MNSVNIMNSVAYAWKKPLSESTQEEYDKLRTFMTGQPAGVLEERANRYRSDTLAYVVTDDVINSRPHRTMYPIDTHDEPEFDWEG